VNDSGKFFTEVFSSWGADLTLCAAVEGPDGKSTLYGKASRTYHAEAKGEVVFGGVDIGLKEGPARAVNAIPAGK